MDPLVTNFSFGLIFASSSAALWLLNKEHASAMAKYRTIEARLAEVEGIFSELKRFERDIHKRQARQANLDALEEKMRKAEKHLLSAKAKISYIEPDTHKA